MTLARRGSGRWARRLARAAHELGAYWRESERLGDLVSLVRLRLAQSRIGARLLVRPFVVDVNLASFGASVRFRSHTTDIYVLREILFSEGLPGLPAWLESNTIIDLGANTGLTFRYLQRRYPDAKFVCVEPALGNLGILRVNVGVVEARCEIVSAAVGGRERTARLSTLSGEWGFQLQDVGASDGPVVEVMTMDGLLQRTGIDRVGILKCDIEGAEAELFADCRSWIQRVETMAVECHDDFMPAATLLPTLTRNGASFQVLNIEPNPGVGEVMTLVREGVHPLQSRR